MNIISKISRQFFTSSNDNSQIKLAISRLRSDNDDVLTLLANVLDDVTSNRYTSDEEIWIDRIESLRNELNTSLVKISVTDYGAGSPDMSLTAGEMYQGRVVERTIGESSKSASKPYKWDLLLFKLIREFQPSICIEMGTAVGISAAYEAAACELNDKGKVLTLEGAESLVALSKENFKKLSLDRVNVVAGRFQDTLPDVLQKNAPVDFIFIDGHHDEEATVKYYQQIVPYLCDNAIVVFDDIAWSNGMTRAWNKIKDDVNLRICMDLITAGICIFTKSVAAERKYYKIAI